MWLQMVGYLIVKSVLQTKNGIDLLMWIQKANKKQVWKKDCLLILRICGCEYDNLKCCRLTNIKWYDKTVITSQSSKNIFYSFSLLLMFQIIIIVISMSYYDRTNFWSYRRK